MAAALRTLVSAIGAALVLIGCGGGGSAEPGTAQSAGAMKNNPQACFTGPTAASASASGLSLGQTYTAVDCSTGYAVSTADVQANNLAAPDQVNVSYHGTSAVGSCGGGDSFVPGGSRTAINFNACASSIDLTVCIARQTWIDGARTMVKTSLLGCTTKTFAAM